MLIERHGDPTKEADRPEQYEYRFQCENCGCVFREWGRECSIIPLKDCRWSTVEIMITHRCPNCGETLHGKKI